MICGKLTYGIYLLQNSGHALLAVYNVFTTGEKLFKAITEYYDERDTGENPSRPVRDR